MRETWGTLFAVCGPRTANMFTAWGRDKLMRQIAILIIKICKHHANAFKTQQNHGKHKISAQHTQEKALAADVREATNYVKI